mmetsp:Transcript_51181/g.133790  ORF Transcript_51181/g.133790 Transcript_51181/m.133790 type:complete len:299 (+) Transcript_51181:83-979(+)|eukprot:CAMPEP_0113666016 /NCGR_PEP_ID=MMETSP0038_2-20120614/2630_1 /TAXON_ID=2898 /ORGANISM="Cryptomonas paramecium" /LENGTH=298 /DNA_ID=CAMNT_0000581441 /DNA_START=83 /DNA_END=979 /DNA_ORIENTATION=+ /assembly_acc=CAM_ASM_000170
MSSWPTHGKFLIPGFNDTWNMFQRYRKGKRCSCAEWKEARRELRMEYEAGLSGKLPSMDQLVGIKRATATLSVEQVVEIFKYKNIGKRGRLGSWVAREFGVSAKAVRDIWRGRTWGDITCFVPASMMKGVLGDSEGVAPSGHCRATTHKQVGQETFRETVCSNLSDPEALSGDESTNAPTSTLGNNNRQQSTNHPPTFHDDLLLVLDAQTLPLPQPFELLPDYDIHPWWERRDREPGIVDGLDEWESCLPVQDRQDVALQDHTTVPSLPWGTGGDGQSPWAAASLGGHPAPLCASLAQ